MSDTGTVEWLFRCTECGREWHNPSVPVTKCHRDHPPAGVEVVHSPDGKDIDDYPARNIDDTTEFHQNDIGESADE